MKSQQRKTQDVFRQMFILFTNKFNIQSDVLKLPLQDLSKAQETKLMQSQKYYVFSFRCSAVNKNNLK